MPDYAFTFNVDDISPQKAGAIRDKLADRLGAEDVTVVSSSMAQRSITFRVRGVDTTDDSVFEESVEAQDGEAAAAKVETETRIVVDVQQR